MAGKSFAMWAVWRLPLLTCSAAIVSAIGLAAFATPPEASPKETRSVTTQDEFEPAGCEDGLSRLAYASSTVAGGPKESSGHDHSGTDEHGGRKDKSRLEQQEESDRDGHDHGAKGSDDEREPLLGRLHPIIIHFPIAGMPIAMLGFLVWVRSGREAFARSDAIPLFVATLASIAAVVTGNTAHDSMQFSESLHVIVERHQFVSTTVMVVAICLSIIRLWRWNGLTGKWRWVYGGGLAIVCMLLGYTGFLGGSLVFGPDHLAW